MRAHLAMLSRVPFSAALPILAAVFAAVMIGGVAVSVKPLVPGDGSGLPHHPMAEMIRHFDVTSRLRIADFPSVDAIQYRDHKDQSRFVSIDFPPPIPVKTESYIKPETVSEYSHEVTFELPPLPRSRPNDDPLLALAMARDYLIETSEPGGTMSRQGPAFAIGHLHPEFVLRLAGAIREARTAFGLKGVGVFSAYRPPILGVGGFSDKFNSLHAYGLAVDMRGIGGPGSNEAKLWHKIAARTTLCVYVAKVCRRYVGVPMRIIGQI